MIVEPDFLTHWKTRALVRTLDYEAAPLCVLAMWAHCQSRKTDRLAVSDEAFASICGYPFPNDAEKFVAAMKKHGFIEIEDGAIVAHDFAEVNAQLFANWRNGLRGGRPMKTHQEPLEQPTDNPPKTQSENGVSDRLDKIGLEKKDRSRSEKIDLKYPADAGAGFRELFEKWVVFRKGLGKKPKDWNVLFQEQIDWLFTFPSPWVRSEIVSQSLRNGWQGLFEPKNSPQQPRSKQSGTALSEKELLDLPVTTL